MSILIFKTRISIQLESQPTWSAPVLTSGSVVIPEQLTPPLDSPYRITPKIEKTNSRVKCFKTAIIPSLTKAELGTGSYPSQYLLTPLESWLNFQVLSHSKEPKKDCAPKITSYQGVKMATNVISKSTKANGSTTPKSKSMSSTKSSANT